MWGTSQPTQTLSQFGNFCYPMDSCGHPQHHTSFAFLSFVLFTPGLACWKAFSSVRSSLCSSSGSAPCLSGVFSCIRTFPHRRLLLFSTDARCGLVVGTGGASRDRVSVAGSSIALALTASFPWAVGRGLVYTLLLPRQEDVPPHLTPSLSCDGFSTSTWEPEGLCCSPNISRSFSVGEMGGRT